MTAGLAEQARRIADELLRSGRLRYEPLDVRCSACGSHPGTKCRLVIRRVAVRWDPERGRPVGRHEVRVSPEERAPHMEREVAAWRASQRWARAEGRRRARAAWGS